MDNFIPEDDKLYFKKDLLRFLKQQGLPHSKPTLIKYEKMGVIPSPRRRIEGFKLAWRIYTGATIKEIASILRKMISYQ